MRRLASALSCAFAFILVLAGPLAAAPRYYYQDLGVLPGGNQSYAYGLNHAGQVVGEANLNPSGGANHAFLKTRGLPMQDLGAMETGGDSKAHGINDAGQVVGEGSDTGYTRAFLKNPGQAMVDLGSLGGASRARAINRAGQVEGWTDYDDGQVTGVRAFLKKPGEDMVSLGTLGGWWSDAMAINDAGQVAGTSLLPKDFENKEYARAYLKNPGEDMQDLGALGGVSSLAYAINDAGQVVGWAEDTTDHFKAFLWEKGVIYNLNRLTVNLPGNGEWPGVFLGSATAINDRGCIVGSTGNWPPHAFLLTPVTGGAALDLLLLD